jgi:hypothetical protein
MPTNWIVKARKLSNSEPFYDSKKNLIWDGKAVDITLCSVNPTKGYAIAFAKQVKNNVKEGEWRIFISDQNNNEEEL